MANGLRGWTVGGLVKADRSEEGEERLTVGNGFTPLTVSSPLPPTRRAVNLHHPAECPPPSTVRRFPVGKF